MSPTFDLSIAALPDTTRPGTTVHRPIPWRTRPTPPALAEVMDQLGQVVQHLLLAALTRVEAPVEEGAPARMAANEAVSEPAPHALPAGSLSPRECQVLAHVAAGESNKRIARSLGLSPHTVKRHVANILDKLSLDSRGQAAAWWLTRRPPAHAGAQAAPARGPADAAH